MALPNSDNIAAIATAQGRGGVGVVRVSGKGLAAMAEQILGRVPSPRHATYSDFLDAQGAVLDKGIALFFPAPHSYTGEEVLELQGHGGPAILQLLLQRCLACGARLAQPGEFTRRAYLNNKLDLAQAESVADLINANTVQAARSAVRSMQGEFSLQIQAMVDQLIHLRMLVEAMLDFPEEEIDLTDVDKRNRLLQGLQQQLQQVLAQARQGSLLREGAHVVIAGQPNVGKSSLLNRLSGEDVALVSDIPGTTRDVIRQVIQIEGVPFHVLDTAGLRESEDAVENMGIARTHKMLQQADLILLLLDAARGFRQADKEILQQLPQDIPRLFVINKSDLATMSMDSLPADEVLTVSAKTGEGLDGLRRELLRLIGWRDCEGGVFMARERHLHALNAAREYMDSAASVLEQPELFAESLREAQHCLSEITGEFSSDDLLGEIFSRFCIGK